MPMLEYFYHVTADSLEHGGGSGTEMGTYAIVFAGIASLIATVLSCLSIWYQLKNYRKPLLQRYVVRILLMVPIYAISSWVSLMSLTAAQFLDPIRDIYEAFTIYTFFQLLINFLGGERALIIMMHGRAPREHVWPLNHFLPKVDISDPHTFLAVKRGILQYAWLKAPLALSAVIMKATDTYQEGYVGLKSGYFWSGIIYNISVTVSLYCLGIFWVCMARDLRPFRPVPKFLCVKLIIFFSYWQGFFLSILVWLGVIHDVGYYTPDNIARAIQDVLICFELPGFAIAHWHAFSWKDYADNTISAARMPVYYALRDSFGVRDLVEDSKQTFRGGSYQYRLFDSSEEVMSHPDSNTRTARMMEGLRYERGGKGKYWVPQPTSRTGLFAAPGPSSQERLIPAGEAESGEHRARRGGDYGAMEETDLNEDDENLYKSARSLEFGDYNYPVITANRPYTNHRCGYERTYDSEHITPNKNLLRPTLQLPHAHRKGKSKNSTSSSPLASPRKKSKVENINPLLHHSPSSASSNVSGRSGLVDLVVEDKAADEMELARARKEGGPGWNEVEPRRLVRQYPPEVAGEEIRIGFEPSAPPVKSPKTLHATQGDPEGPKFTIGDDGDEDEGLGEEVGQGDRPDTPREGYKDIEDSPWKRPEDNDDDEAGNDSDGGYPAVYGSMNERNVWG